MSTDFSSLDKLVEFGLGVGVATQMMNTMNATISRMAVPGVGLNPGLEKNPQLNPAGVAPAGAPVQKSYYIVKEEKVAGPFTEQELTELVSKHRVTKNTFCWYPGLPSWKMAQDIPEVNKLILLNS